MGKPGELRMAKNNSGHILIAICTLGKNNNLLELLRQLCQFRLCSQHQIRILVVWNSTEKVQIPIPTDIEIHRSPVQGYANARNAALNQRRPEESLWFIDDDEIIKLQTDAQSQFTTNFLEIYLSAAEAFPDSIFVGPYLPIDEIGTKVLLEWKEIPKMEYGEIMNFGSGGNLFLPSTIFKKQTIHFDPFFNFGGEDTKLVRDLARTGIATRWVPDAVLYEKTPPHRFNRGWQGERKLRNYLINTIIQLERYQFTPIRRFCFAIKVLLNLSLRNRSVAGVNLNIKKKFELFLAVSAFDCQRLKAMAVRSDLID